MQKPTKLRKSNLLRFIVIKAKYDRARFFFRTKGGKVSWRILMDQVEISESTAKRWEQKFRDEWRNR